MTAGRSLENPTARWQLTLFKFPWYNEEGFTVFNALCSFEVHCCRVVPWFTVSLSVLHTKVFEFNVYKDNERKENDRSTSHTY